MDTASRRQLLVAAGSALALGAVSACSGGAHPAGSRVTTSPIAHAVASASTPVTAGPDPAQPLPLPDPGRVLFQASDRTGSDRSAALPPIDPGTLGIDAVCSGPGKIVVGLSDIGTFDVSCGAASPGEYNQLVLSSSYRSVRVSVQGSSRNTWALTLGWTDSTSHPAD
ncbi:hypothetical protein GXW82_32720 [Streptacidiphilus sp. 4-A2]|nr:hypothetical protein [Streptacidiphilus sp. 4-A2]